MISELLRNWPIPEVTGYRLPTSIQPVDDQDTVFLRTEIFLKSLKPESRQLYEAFLPTEPALAILSKIIAFIPTSAEEKAGFKKVVAGRIFEGLATNYFAGKLNSNQILLSGEDLLTFYRLRYPNREILNDFGIKLAILGVSVPDGLRLRRGKHAWQIDQVHEYKLGGETAEIAKQVKYYGKKYLFYDPFDDLRAGSKRLGRLLNKVRSDLPLMPVAISPKLRLVVAVPENMTHLWSNSYPIPISSIDFGMVQDTIFDDCKFHQIPAA